MFSLNDKRETNQGFGDGMSRAFELAVTPLIFGAAGFGLDTIFGTRPVLTVGLAVFAVVGLFVRTWYGYDSQMRDLEAKSAWSPNRSVDAEPAADGDVDLWKSRRIPGGQR